MSKEAIELSKIYYTEQKTYKFYEMQHCGGLKEAVETLHQISEAKFKCLLDDYNYYCYDDRIECLRFIIKDLEHAKAPAWLLISTLNAKTIKDLAAKV